MPKVSLEQYNVENISCSYFFAVEFETVVEIFDVIISK